jgi:hypothetical protein
MTSRYRAPIFALLAAAALAADKRPVNEPVTTQPTPPSMSLRLKWDESSRTFNVPVANDESRVLRVLGVQATAGLFVVDFPKTIPPHGSADFTFLYAARPGLGGTADVIRVRTDRGEKVVQINHDREPTAQLDSLALNWQQDEAARGKSVILTVPARTAVPKGVKAMGSGNAAELQPLGDGRYRVTVTPASTAKPQKFPVFVQLEPAVPGVANVILCSVEPKN